MGITAAELVIGDDFLCTGVDDIKWMEIRDMTIASVFQTRYFRIPPLCGPMITKPA